MGGRQSFRFPLPWLSAPPAPRPTSAADTESPRSVDEILQVPSRKTETDVVQRPPFRPAGKAPVLPPISSSLRNEPRPQASPIQSGIESRAASLPASPSRIGIERGASQSTLSSPTAAQPNATSIVSSPSRAAPQSSPTSVPPSPAPVASQPQTPLKTYVQPQSSLETALQQQSPSRLTSQPPRQTSPQALSPSKVSDLKTDIPSTHGRIFNKPTSVSARQEQTTITPIMQDTPSKTETASEKIYPPDETVNRIQHSETSAPANVLPSFPDSKENLEAAKEETKLMQEQRYEKEQHNIPLPQNTNTDNYVVPLSSKTQTKEQLNNAVNEKQEVRKPDIREKKEPLSTIHSTAKEKNHKPVNGEQSPLHKDIKEDISKFVYKLGATHLSHTVNDTPITVITLSGENRGASMQLSTEYGHKEKFVHIHRGYKSNPDESIDATTDTEGSTERGSEPPLNKEDEATNAYINSNVQSINNSIVFDSSISEQSAGVQFHSESNTTHRVK